MMTSMRRFSRSIPFIVVGLILTLVSCQAVGEDRSSSSLAVTNVTKSSTMYEARGRSGFQRGPSSDATTTQKLNFSAGSSSDNISSSGINYVQSSNLGSYEPFGRDDLGTSANFSSSGQGKKLVEQPVSKIAARSLIISVGGGGITKTNPLESNRGNNPNGPANSQQQSNSNPSSGSQQRPSVNPPTSPPSTSNNSQQSGSNTISNTQNSSSNAASNPQQSIKNSTSNSSQSTSNSAANPQQSSSNATLNPSQSSSNDPSSPPQSSSNATSNPPQSSNATSNPPQSSNATSNSPQSSANATSIPHQSLQNEPNPAVESLKRNINFASRTDSSALLRNAAKQTPKLYWIGCSDSRVSETLLIEAELGEVFVERNIANLFKAEDARTSAGMEYAIHALNISHVVLVGHEGCGGCVTALASARENATGKAPSGKLGVGEQAIVDWIAPIRQMAVDMLKRIGGTDAQRYPTPQEYRKQLSTLVELNVFQQARNILTSPVVIDAKRQGRSIWVYGWIYDIETGKIRQVLSEYSS